MSSAAARRVVVDLTDDGEESSSGVAAATPTRREHQLEQQVAALKRQLELQQQQQQSTVPLRNRESVQSALLDFLADPRATPDDVDRFLRQFAAAAGVSARACYETLLDADASTPPVLGKLRVLQRHGLHCPREVWRLQRKVETIAVMVPTLGADGVGRLLAALYGTMTLPRPDCSDLTSKLDSADLLLVACAMAEPLRLTPRQRVVFPIVHYARHGPTERLFEQLRGVVPEVTHTTHNDFPLLFQPLIEMRGVGWVERLRVLLDHASSGGTAASAAAASVVYRPWHCSALHMLFYTKSGGASRPTEAALVRATELLLAHGASRVLNLVDTTAGGGGGGGGVHHRTALMQAASGGHYAACVMLLAAGADADVYDSSDQSVVDILFYLKHSRTRAHRAASATYTCMDLYALVNRFHLGGLVRDEMRQDCRDCGACRYLLASVPDPSNEEQHDEASSSSSESSESDAESESEPEANAIEASSKSDAMSTGARMLGPSHRPASSSVHRLFARLRV